MNPPNNGSLKNSTIKVLPWLAPLHFPHNPRGGSDPSLPAQGEAVFNVLQSFFFLKFISHLCTMERAIKGIESGKNSRRILQSWENALAPRNHHRFFPHQPQLMCMNIHIQRIKFYDF
eukprot:jgi/Botrbrau1/10181/Bobra.0121s0024.1